MTFVIMNLDWWIIHIVVVTWTGGYQYGIMPSVSTFDMRWKVMPGNSPRTSYLCQDWWLDMRQRCSLLLRFGALSCSDLQLPGGFNQFGCSIWSFISSLWKLCDSLSFLCDVLFRHVLYLGSFRFFSREQRGGAPFCPSRFSHGYFLAKIGFTAVSLARHEEDLYCDNDKMDKCGSG